MEIFLLRHTIFGHNKWRDRIFETIVLSFRNGEGPKVRQWSPIRKRCDSPFQRLLAIQASNVQPATHTKINIAEMRFRQLRRLTCYIIETLKEISFLVVQFNVLCPDLTAQSPKIN